MSMPPRPNSLSRTSGFVPLSGGGNRSNMHDDAIQLTTVRSNASTGARKANPGHSSSFDSPRDEKGHHHHFRRGRRQKPKDESLGRKQTDDGEGASLNFMGRLYYKIIGFSVVSRYLVYIIPVAILLAVPLVVIPVTGNRGKIHVGNQGPRDDPVLGPPLFDLFLWIEITWCTVWLAKLVAWFLPKLFMFFSGIVSMGTRKYATVLKNLTIPMSLLFWALAVWLTFKNLFKSANDRDIRWVRTLETILGALFACSAVFLGEKAIVQLIGVTYHQRSFALRIKASKREIRLLGMLYEASRTLFPMYCPEFAEEDYTIDDSIDMMLRGKHGRTKSGSATPMRLIGDVIGEAGRVGDKVTSAFGNIASEITGKKVFNPNSSHSIVLEALEKLRTSEALARRIWMSFVVEGKEALFLEDVKEVLGPAYKDEADEAFNFIDNDENGDISLDEMIRKVVDMGKERKAIAEGMKDIGQALGAFDKVLLFVVLLICVFIFLAFFQSSFVNVIASAGTALLSLSFIFAVTCQEFLGSCIFLFVKHPYDVGDRVDISDIKLVVERISLLYTVFHRLDTGQVSQVPNIQLNNLWVDNLSRSKAMVECIEVDVSYDTTFEDIELLRMEMERFVRASENARDFKPDFTISVSSVGSLDKLTLVLAIKHKSNWHNDAVRATRRSKFMCALALALKRVPIYGPAGNPDPLGGPANPTYSVAVSDDWAANSRDKSAKSKQDQRMAASHSQPEEVAEVEMAAAAGINSRPPVPEMGMASQWDQRDDRTLGDQSDDSAGRRSREIESIRTDLLRRASTRGRRRAGESAPSLSEQGAHVSPTATRLSGFDEEATTGMPSSFYEQNRNRAFSTSQHLSPSSSAAAALASGTQARGGPSHPAGPSNPFGGPQPPAGQR